MALLFPPEIHVLDAPFSPGHAVDAFAQKLCGAGAVAMFLGLARDEGGALKALELEHYPGMCEAELMRLAQEAAQRFALLALSIIHRYGVIVPGEAIVLVQTASLHRAEALEACAFLMDFLKTQAPFWKKEHYADKRAPHWVEARAADDAARAKWQE